MRLKKIITSLVAITSLIGALYFFFVFTLSSVDELLFRYRLSKFANSTDPEVRLDSLTTFEWEEVCSSHPYDGDFKHPKTGHIYTPPIEGAHKGVAVFLFLAHNGDPTFIIASCRRGGANILEFGCHQRREARLVRENSSDCPTFSIQSTAP